MKPDLFEELREGVRQGGAIPRDTQKQYSMSLAQPTQGAAPNMVLQRTRRPRVRSPLSRRLLGDGRR